MDRLLPPPTTPWQDTSCCIQDHLHHQAELPATVDCLLLQHTGVSEKFLDYKKVGQEHNLYIFSLLAHNRRHASLGQCGQLYDQQQLHVQCVVVALER